MSWNFENSISGLISSEGSKHRCGSHVPCHLEPPQKKALSVPPPNRQGSAGSTPAFEVQETPWIWTPAAQREAVCAFFFFHGVETERATSSELFQYRAPSWSCVERCGGWVNLAKGHGFPIQGLVSMFTSTVGSSPRPSPLFLHISNSNKSQLEV